MTQTDLLAQAAALTYADYMFSVVFDEPLNNMGMVRFSSRQNRKNPLLWKYRIVIRLGDRLKELCHGDFADIWP